jgi:hypothetical protein
MNEKTPFSRAKALYGKQMRTKDVEAQLAQMQEQAPEMALQLMTNHLLYLLLEQLDENADLLHDALDRQVDAPAEAKPAEADGEAS